MKRLSILVLCSFVLIITSAPAMAQLSYCKDFLEDGNPGGWGTSSKTFDDHCTLTVPETIDVDIWLNDLPEELLTSGFIIDLGENPPLSLVSIDAYDDGDLPSPWDPGFTNIFQHPENENLFLVQLGNWDCVIPDGDGDIIQAKVRLRCDTDGEAEVIISAIDPYSTDLNVACTSRTVYDSQIAPNYLTIHCLPGDADADDDGVTDDQDNCPMIPNGANEGTCTSGYIGVACMTNGECGVDGFCSTNQEDTDTDGVGDVCDNCPDTTNGNQLDTFPSDGNNCGDTCECEGNFDGDQDCDGTDAAAFKADFGRSQYKDPCTDSTPCKGDFECDVDVDGTDAAGFKADFGRSQYKDPCPSCTTDPWCDYPE